MAQLDFDQRPILVFWESTRSCQLACRHCRAEAMPHPLPGELSTAEGLRFIDSLTQFGRPYPVLIITGGDVLMRPDAFELVAHANDIGIPVGLAPSVTPNLSEQNIYRMRALGVKAVSISLDGATASTHDGIRGVDNHLMQTKQALERLVVAGFTVQVNTVVMQDNVAELPRVVKMLKDIGVHIWEVFFLVTVGRGREVVELNASDCEDVAHFLYDCSKYDLTVRTVEAPHFRRVVQWRANDEREHPDNTVQDVADKYHLGSLYRRLSRDLHHLMGAPTSSSLSQTRGTRDGKGVIFVSHDGNVYPSGFLPIPLGNVRDADLATIYREHRLLQDIRKANFSGKCGTCDYRDVCGGSRSRAFASQQDPLGSDPACIYTFEPAL